MIDKKTFEFILEHENDDVRNLALQAKRYPEIDMTFAIRQISGMQISKEKIPLWYENKSVIYPPHISLEQSSSEKTANYKALLCDGSSFVDLTGGLGVDFSFMSKQFSSATYVEKQSELVDIAKQNFKTLGLNNAEIINDSAESYLSKMNSVDVIFIDPARRDSSGKKTVLIEDCSPNLLEIETNIDDKSKRALIKLSPMLDISRALHSLSKITEVHVISINNECKELLFVREKNKEEETIFRCVNIQNDKTDRYDFTRSQEANTTPTPFKEIREYLYEPNASILKAGAYKKIAADFGLEKLHPNSHLYTSEKLEADFPGRKFIVKDWFPFSKKELKDRLKDIEKANITCRNFHLSVDEIRKKTSLKEGGDLYIFATTIDREKKILVICQKLDSK